MMKRLILIFFSIILFCGSCSKKNDPTSGEVTLDNKLYGSGPYYALGFKFSLAKKISTLATEGPDITVEAGTVETGGPVVAYLASNTYEPAFYLVGEYGTATEAAEAFETLYSFGISTWSDFGTPLAENQIWIFRTENETYAKILILSVSLNTTENPDYASCTFKWVYQPDGSTSFPK
jgi:hypothetical protein